MLSNSDAFAKTPGILLREMRSYGDHLLFLEVGDTIWGGGPWWLSVPWMRRLLLPTISFHLQLLFLAWDKKCHIERLFIYLFIQSFIYFLKNFPCSFVPGI